MSARKPEEDSARALRVERKRLARIFAALLAPVAPSVALAACTVEVAGDPGLDPAPQGHDPDPGVADAARDGAPDASPDVAPDAPEDAVSCALTETILEAGPDADPPCIYGVPCGLGDAIKAVGCDLFIGPNAATSMGCSLVEGAGCTNGHYTPGPGGAVSIYCLDCMAGGGRRPEGLGTTACVRAPSAAAAYFAAMARAERVSVGAFRRMRHELVAFGAPAALVREADRAARDEVRHARAMARRARGARVDGARPPAFRPRTLEAFARENAVEGCVRETWGALLLTWQAAHAPDRRLGRTFARVAADEVRHAAFAWAVATWAEARLASPAHARLAAARRRATRELSLDTANGPFDAAVGLPALGERRVLLERVAAAHGFEPRPSAAPA